MKLPAFLRTFSTLQLALGISVAVHAALISVRFIDPEGFNRVFQDTPLEVILVNAKSNERPDKAQAIAQANLAGGGDAEKGRATSPLPYTALTTVGDDYEEAHHQPRHARRGLRHLLRRPAPQGGRQGHRKLPRTGRQEAVWRADHDRHRQPRRPRARHRGGTRLRQPHAGPARRGDCPGGWPVWRVWRRHAQEGRP